MKHVQINSTSSIYQFFLVMSVLLCTQCKSSKAVQADTQKAWTCGETLVYEGQSYATIQMGEQCWMAENLNVGRMIKGAADMSDNNVLEKYCYDNDAAQCTSYGALYQWDEIMQYTTVEGAQGICPDGWHLPTDKEWMKMEETLGICAGKQFGCSGSWEYRGTNQGSQLAGNKALWHDDLNYRLSKDPSFGTSGFKVLPAGLRSYSKDFGNLGFSTRFWTSSTDGNPAAIISRGLDCENTAVERTDYNKLHGYSVRCIKD